MVANFKHQTMWTEDNLPVMRGMNSACVDLIYLDPPFNSNADYAAPIGSKAAGAEFKDTWSLSDVDVEWINLIEAKHRALYRVLLATITKSDKSYLVYMAARILEMHRILKPTGSIYLHCDSTMSHYLKLVMDAVFGHGNFRNEIIWERIKGAGKRSQYDIRNFGRSSDSVLFYTRGDDYRFDADAVARPYPDIDRAFPYKDGKGRYKRRSPFRPPGLGSRPNLCYEYKGVTPPHPSGWTVKRERLAALDADGELEWVGTTPWRKQRPSTGIIPNNIWADINLPTGKERTDYPTQKPLALLNRIIRASSKPGDMILDPFCGCATACVSAEIQGREWVGIDISPKAAELVAERMKNELGLFYKGAYRRDLPRRTDLGKVRPYNSPENRKYLYGEQGGHCAGCGTHFLPQHLTVDHIVSSSKSGGDHLENLQLLCGHCNSIKGDRGMEYLMSKLQMR